MNIFRHLLFWIVLALVGALIAQLLLQDPGYVLVRYRGSDYTTTVAAGLLVLLATLAGLWLVWKVLSLPLRALRTRRERAARARLGDGLDALHHGYYARAEKLLAQAADDDHHGAAAARVAAARAAQARGDAGAARAQLDALGERHSASRAIALAERALAEGHPADALAVLDAAIAPLPPRALALRAEAFAASGNSVQAYGMLGPLRQQQALPASRLGELERTWAEAALRQAADANALADRWETLPKPLRSEPGVVLAYAERAAALRWDDAAVNSIEQALDTRWDETLAARYGSMALTRTDAARLEARRANAERWLQAHPASPALLLTLARLSRQQGQWPQAEQYLHRAIAQGAGAEAWEELGHGYAQGNDDARARSAYANALRAIRGETIKPSDGRDLKQKIFDEAAVEERDAHGVPRLRQ